MRWATSISTALPLHPAQSRLQLAGGLRGPAHPARADAPSPTTRDKALPAEADAQHREDLASAGLQRQQIAAGQAPDRLSVLLEANTRLTEQVQRMASDTSMHADSRDHAKVVMIGESSRLSVVDSLGDGRRSSRTAGAKVTGPSDLSNRISAHCRRIPGSSTPWRAGALHPDAPGATTSAGTSRTPRRAVYFNTDSHDVIWTSSEPEVAQRCFGSLVSENQRTLWRWWRSRLPKGA